MPNGPICATVYIWYPYSNDNPRGIGHASMYIGNYQVGSRFELSLDMSPTNPLRRDKSEVEVSVNQRFGSVYYNDNYVSWYPEGRVNVFKTVEDSRSALGLYEDYRVQKSTPHVTYNLYGLDVTAMRGQWRKDRDKVDSHFKFYGKNCSTMVARVMRAGGADKHLGGNLASAWFAHNAIWTPHKVARFCNHLRPNHAEKSKAGNCPAKRDHVLLSLIGMR